MIIKRIGQNQFIVMGVMQNRLFLRLVNPTLSSLTLKVSSGNVGSNIDLGENSPIKNSDNPFFPTNLTVQKSN